MTRIYALLFATALLLNACATAGPIAIKCGLQDVSIAASDYAEIKADVDSKNWDDLAKVAETIGWATLDCVLGDQAKTNPAMKGNIDEFRRLHSVELRAAGRSACRAPQGIERAPSVAISTPAPLMTAPGSEQLSTQKRPAAKGPTGAPPADQFAYAGETVGHAVIRCAAACGAEDAIGSPGTSCQCWAPRAFGGRGGWVAAR